MPDPTRDHPLESGSGRGRAPVRGRSRRAEWWRASLFLVASVLATGVFLFTHQMVQRLSHEVATTSRVLARFCAEASLPATRDPELRNLLGEVLENVDFPLVISDTTGLPRAWQDIGVSHRLIPAATLDSLEAKMPISPVNAARIDFVRSKIPELDRKNRPIPMWQTRPDSVRLGLVHYGDPPVLDLLRWMPYLSVGGLLLLLTLGLWGVTGIRQAERRSIWVGMARETAHQLGTPLSSMMGWIELLRSRGDGLGSHADVVVPKAELDETLDEMERDIDRLNKVAQRFSHVGSAPVLQLKDPVPLVRQAVHYAQRRLPRGDGDVAIRERYDDVEPVKLNSELLEWAVENLLSNAVSALDKRPGVIEVSVGMRRENESLEIVVSDNGRGMTPDEQRRCFEPGYTTKRRGWGLGLALSRRVVEEYHGGRLFVRESAPGQGTTMVISFPT